MCVCVGACARSQKVCATRSVATSRKTRTPWTNTLVRVLLQWELSFFAPPRRKGVESRVESAVAFDSVALSACASPLSRGSHPQARRFSCACLRVINKKIKTSVRFRSNKTHLFLYTMTVQASSCSCSHHTTTALITRTPVSFSCCSSVP